METDCDPGFSPSLDGHRCIIGECVQVVDHLQITIKVNIVVIGEHGNRL